MAPGQKSLFINPPTPQNSGETFRRNASVAERIVREFSGNMGLAPPRMKLESRVYPAASMSVGGTLGLSCAAVMQADEYDMRGFIAHEMVHCKKKHAVKFLFSFAIMQAAEIAGFIAAFYAKSPLPAIAGVVAKNAVLGVISAKMEQEANRGAGMLNGTTAYLDAWQGLNRLKDEPGAKMELALYLLAEPHLIVEWAIAKYCPSLFGNKKKAEVNAHA